MLKFYEKNGYRIRASEKAYHKLYKKNGFKPVDEGGATEAPPKTETSPAVKGEATKKKSGKTGKAKEASIPATEIPDKTDQGEENSAEDADAVEQLEDE